MNGADKCVSKHKAIIMMRQKRPLRSPILFWAWHVQYPSIEFNSHKNYTCVEHKRNYQFNDCN